MTVTQVMDYTAWSRSTIYDLVRARRIEHIRLGRTIRFRRSVIDAKLRELSYGEVKQPTPRRFRAAPVDSPPADDSPLPAEPEPKPKRTRKRTP
jgi:excisionase family DNA binding protein